MFRFCFITATSIGLATLTAGYAASQPRPYPVDSQYDYDQPSGTRPRYVKPRPKMAPRDRMPPWATRPNEGPNRSEARPVTYRPDPNRPTFRKTSETRPDPFRPDFARRPSRPMGTKQYPVRRFEEQPRPRVGYTREVDLEDDFFEAPPRKFVPPGKNPRMIPAQVAAKHRVPQDSVVLTGKEAVRELVKGIGGTANLIKGADGKLFIPIPHYRPGNNILGGSWEARQIRDQTGNPVEVVDLRKPVSVVQSKRTSSNERHYDAEVQEARHDREERVSHDDRREREDVRRPQENERERGNPFEREDDEDDRPVRGERTRTSPEPTPSPADSLPPPNAEDDAPPRRSVER